MRIGTILAALVLAVVCATSALALSGGGGGGGGGGSAAVNTLPAYVSKSLANGGGVTSLVPNAPASISTGNPLYAFIAVQGVTAETWTPASGFNQIGSTYSSQGGDKLVGAVFCKTATGSEPGTYTFAFNNAGTFAEMIIANISGGSCTPDATGTSVSKTNIPSVAPFALSKANDLLLITATNAFNASAMVLTSPGNATIINQTQATYAATVSQGGLTTPSVTYQYGSTDDAILVVTAIPAAATASVSLVGNGGSATLTDLNLLNGSSAIGVTSSNGGFYTNTDVGAGSGGQGGGGFMGLNTSNGKIITLMGTVSGAIAIDPNQQSSNLLRFGDAVNNNEGSYIISPGATYGVWTPDTGSTDMPMIGMDVLGNWRFGCVNAASGNIGLTSCTPAVTHYSPNDMYFDLYTGRKWHWENSSTIADIMSLNASVQTTTLVAAATPTGLTVTPTGGTATQRCYRVACLSGSYTTLAESEVCDAAGPTTLDASHFETVKVNFPEVGCDHMQFYGRATGAELATSSCPGGTNCIAYAGTVAQTTIAWKDDGSQTPSGALPGASTNIGHYDVTSPSVNLLAGSTLQSTGGSIPTCSCTGGSPTCVTTAGSTNNRGDIHMTGGTAVTTCTLTFNTSNPFNQAPFCSFTDGRANVAPLAFSAGAITATTAIVDFASSTTTDIIYICM